MNKDFERIGLAINYLRENFREQPGLNEVASHCGLSPYHFQRLFRRWAGVSPKQFLQFLTVQHAKELLANSTPTLDASFESGLSSPGRLHDHLVTIEAVTPGELKTGGDGLVISYGLVNSPFGSAFVAMTPRGICALEFLGDEPMSEALGRLQQRWPEARLIRNDSSVASRTEGVFDLAPKAGQLKLLVRGTNFQVQVWQGLLKIPPGHLCAYAQLAEYLDKPKATRAVASAIGANAIAYLIPCHRVLRSSGELGGYRWGLDIKQAMLAREQCIVTDRSDASETGLAASA